MPINLQNLNSFKVEHNRVHLTNDYLSRERWRFKKITGTRFAAILGLSKYNSPFKTWMGMVNLYKDVMDPTLAKAGNIIEPKIREYVSKILNVEFKVHDPRTINWDAFKDNKIFGGIPDGEPLNKLKVIDYSSGMPMLEIKTSSIDSFVYKRERNELKMIKDDKGFPLIKEKGTKKASWYSNGEIVISNEYCMQLGLYLYLRNASYGVFGIAFLEPEDYVIPEHFQANKHDIQIVKFNIQRSKIEPYIKYATQWYNDYIDKGISPEMTEEDYAWLKSELEIIGK